MFFWNFFFTLQACLKLLGSKNFQKISILAFEVKKECSLPKLHFFLIFYPSM